MTATSSLLLKVEHQLLFGSGTLLLGFGEQEGTQAFRAEFVDADDGLRKGGGKFPAGNEVFGFLHDHAHLLEVVGGDAVEAARIDDEDS